MVAATRSSTDNVFSAMVLIVPMAEAAEAVVLCGPATTSAAIPAKSGPGSMSKDKGLVKSKYTQPGGVRFASNRRSK